MSRGPKPISRAEVIALAKEAETILAGEQAIDSYAELGPVMDHYISAGKQGMHCFAFLKKKGIVEESQQKSFLNAFSEYKRNKSNE